MNTFTIDTMPSSYTKCINAAITVATKSDILHKHGCVISRNGKIISTGYNNERSYSKDGLIESCSSCHAEISAIRNIPCLSKLVGNYRQWVQ